MRKALLILGILLLDACARVPITGRKQLNLVSETEMINMSLQAYHEFLGQNAPLPSSDDRVALVQRVGNKLATSATAFLKQAGASERVAGFNWEFNVVD